MKIAGLILDAIFYAGFIYCMIDYIKMKCKKDDNDNNR